jgi:hypothetical protein
MRKHTSLKTARLSRRLSASFLTGAALVALCAAAALLLSTQTTEAASKPRPNAQARETKAPLATAVRREGGSGTYTPAAVPVANYLITQTTGATITPGTNDIGNHCDDCTTEVALPFPYTLYDRTFTTARITSNGVIQFGGDSGAFSNECLPTSLTDFDYSILAYWDDLRTDDTGGGIFTTVTGTAPNRVFHVEWRSTYFDDNLPVTFEIQLYEAEPRFDFIYGASAQAGNSATVGVQHNAATGFTQYECNTGGLTEGLRLSFTGSDAQVISGLVTDRSGNGISGVTVVLSGAASATRTTDASGFYSFVGLADGDYTVTPARAGYTFTPPAQTIANFTASRTANFIGTPFAAAFSIAGRILDETGRAVGGVNVNLSGAQSTTTTTDASGNFNFNNLAAGGTYRVTPARDGSRFTPEFRDFANLDGNQFAAFTLALDNQGSERIGGRVTSAQGGGLGGVVLTLSDARSGAQLATATSGDEGAYNFDAPRGGSYTVAPSKLGLTFTPTSRTFFDLNAPQTGDFTGANAINVGGRVIDATGSGVDNVIVNLSGTVTRTTVTTAGGFYLFPNLPVGGSYTVTPTGGAQTYTPARLDYNNLTSDARAQITTAPQPSPTPTPVIVGDFDAAQRDPAVFSLGTLTQAPGTTDPLVSVTQQSGQLVITPRTNTNGASFNGYVTVQATDFTNAAASVEVPRTADGGAQTVFSIGTDERNFFRFVAQDIDPSLATSAVRQTSMKQSKQAGVRQQATTVRQLLFQIRQAGVLVNRPGVELDPVQMRFWRFRHDAQLRLMSFETSPTGVEGTWTARASFPLPGGVGPVAAELSAGTAGAVASPGQAIFDNLLVRPGGRPAGSRVGVFGFERASYETSEAAGEVTLRVTRGGATGEAATVDFATEPFDGQPCGRVDGKARPRCDFSTAAGRLRFAPGESTKTITIYLTDDSYVEGSESFRVALSSPSVGYDVENGLASVTVADNDQGSSNLNPINNAPFFVRQQYLDFLYREPDAGGFDAWVGVLRRCPYEGGTGPGKSGSDPACDRITVSAAFFGSPEFRDKGYFVYRFYKASLPDAGASSLAGRQPTYEEFLRDMKSLDGATAAEVVARRDEFAQNWLARPDISALYEGLSNADFVDKLARTAGVTLAARDQIVDELDQRRTTRAEVLRAVVEHPTLVSREFNPAFVLMQYFGYLQRDPDAAGYNNWLTYLNATGDFRTMINGFVYSTEYEARFGQP